MIQLHVNFKVIDTLWSRVLVLRYIDDLVARISSILFFLFKLTIVEQYNLIRAAGVFLLKYDKGHRTTWGKAQCYPKTTVNLGDEVQFDVSCSRCYLYRLKRYQTNQSEKLCQIFNFAYREIAKTTSFQSICLVTCYNYMYFWSLSL